MGIFKISLWERTRGGLVFVLWAMCLFSGNFKSPHPFSIFQAFWITNPQADFQDTTFCTCYYSEWGVELLKLVNTKHQLTLQNFQIRNFIHYFRNKYYFSCLLWTWGKGWKTLLNLLWSWLSHLLRGINMPVTWVLWLESF